jgi:nucleotide sugar dehydrogenase
MLLSSLDVQVSSVARMSKGWGMKVQIVGVGVVGGAQAYLSSRLGHEVVGVDHGRTTFEHARMAKQPERDVDITFICTQESAVPEVVTDLLKRKVGGLYVIKSTVPSGTTMRLMEKHRIHICHNPEFLVEKRALESITHPAMVLIGSCCQAHGNVLRSFYAPLGCPVVVSQPSVTETVKLTLNSYLATLISFWNQIDKVTAMLGVNIEEVAGMVRLDPRVSKYGTEFFGSPFGGKCSPKDLEQLISVSHQVGTDSSMLEAVRDFNKIV